MRLGSLCTGYGGLDIAVQAHYGADLAWVAEVDPWASAVLRRLHPGVPNLGDVTRVSWHRVRSTAPVDVLCAGYPCQPFSTAGQRRGSDDERHLWPHVRRAIQVLAPRKVVVENVRGHLSLGFAEVLQDLADLGFDARWGCVRASDAGAPHKRERIFLVAEDAHHGARGAGAAAR